MTRRTTGMGSSNLNNDSKNTGANQNIVLTVRPPKKATPRRLRINALTRLIAEWKELYFSLIRDTVST